MSSTQKDYGFLINKDIKLHRKYFEQMTKMLGINCIYQEPLPGKDYDMHGHLNTKYKEGVTVGCIFQDHPDQKTLKKMGWVTELQEGSSIIHVPYDLSGIQVGALFTIPSGIDNAPPRVFRVISIQNIMVYPASIACEIAPEYFDRDEQVQFTDFSKEDFTLLIDNEEDD